jgi:hypothetical protein
MNSSIIYVYLGIVMIIVLATTFYVRTIKSKLDTKVDAMFQLVQSLVSEVNQLKMGQHGGSNNKEVIELNINSSNNQDAYTETSDSESSDSESSGSDDDDDDDDEDESPHEVNTQRNLSAEPFVVNVEPDEVNVEPVEVNVEPVEVNVEPVEVNVEPFVVNVEPFVVKVEPVEEPVEVNVGPFAVNVESFEVNVEPVEFEQPVSISEEVKKVVIETAEQNYESFTVKELKELVSAKGGKLTGKKKSDLIEFLLS